MIIDFAGGTLWQESFRIRSYEVDKRGLASVQTICNLMQEVAGNHAYTYGIGVDQLTKQNKTWVLSKLILHIHQYPSWRETVQLTTWPSGVRKMYALRNFFMTNDAGVCLAEATSSWIVIDIETRKPLRNPQAAGGWNCVSYRDVLPGRGIGRIRPVSSEEQSEQFFRIRASDIDVNGHVNNVNYLEWALESMNIDAVAGQDLYDLEAEFLAESLFGDGVTAESRRDRTASEEQAYYHQVERASDQRCTLRARTLWKPSDAFSGRTT